jgi:hypothetical protein
MDNMRPKKQTYVHAKITVIVSGAPIGVGALPKGSHNRRALSEQLDLDLLHHEPFGVESSHRDRPEDRFRLLQLDGQ